MQNSSKLCVSACVFYILGLMLNEDLESHLYLDSIDAVWLPIADKGSMTLFLLCGQI